MLKKLDIIWNNEHFVNENHSSDSGEYCRYNKSNIYVFNCNYIDDLFNY